MTIYKLDILLFLFGTSLFFHVQFYLLLPDLHIGFSRGRSGGLVFPSRSEFSTVYCNPHSQRFMSTESVMPSNHFILSHPLLLPSIFPRIRVFFNKLALHIKYPKYWNFSFSISPSNEYSLLISFRID